MWRRWWLNSASCADNHVGFGLVFTNLYFDHRDIHMLGDGSRQWQLWLRCLLVGDRRLRFYHRRLHTNRLWNSHDHGYVCPRQH
jgi:hypothetical protein